MSGHMVTSLVVIFACLNLLSWIKAMIMYSHYDIRMIFYE